jgi:hypothetical protein
VSVITDLVVANTKDAAQLDDDEYLEKLSYTAMPGLTQAKLASLLWILKSKKGKINPIKQIPLVRSIGETWVYRIPSELLEKLVKLESKSLLKLARLWMDEEAEFELGGWTEVAVQNHLKTLKRLSREALKRNQQLWMRQIL